MNITVKTLRNRYNHLESELMNNEQFQELRLIENFLKCLPTESTKEPKVSGTVKTKKRSTKNRTGHFIIDTYEAVCSTITNKGDTILEDILCNLRETAPKIHEAIGTNNFQRRAKLLKYIDSYHRNNMGAKKLILVKTANKITNIALSTKFADFAA